MNLIVIEDLNENFSKIKNKVSNNEYIKIQRIIHKFSNHFNEQIIQHSEILYPVIENYSYNHILYKVINTLNLTQITQFEYYAILQIENFNNKKSSPNTIIVTILMHLQEYVDDLKEKLSDIEYITISNQLAKCYNDIEKQQLIILLTLLSSSLVEKYSHRLIFSTFVKSINISQLMLTLKLVQERQDRIICRKLNVENLHYIILTIIYFLLIPYKIFIYIFLILRYDTSYTFSD